MTIAFIISAYAHPAQLVRLVRRLQSTRRTFLIHVDRRTASSVFNEMVSGVAGLDNVHFLTRHDCHWGDFGHVRATLAGLDHLGATGVPYDYVALLTGQDYPLTPGVAAEARLGAAYGRSWMNYRPLPVEGLEAGGYARLPSRVLPYGLHPYFGSGYWILHRTAIEYVRGFLARHPLYVPYFERVVVPDEMFFQTILLNSPLRDRIENDDLRLILWPGPKVLTMADTGRIGASTDLFARKFDDTVDAGVLDWIDTHRLGV